MSLWKKFKAWFGRSRFIAVLESAAQNLIGSVSQQGLDLLTEEATRLVNGVEGSGLSSEEKRREVLAKLVQTTQLEGIKTGIATLNLIIEAVVNARKTP